jgi:hypothetical protein
MENPYKSPAPLGGAEVTSPRTGGIAGAVGIALVVIGAVIWLLGAGITLGPFLILDALSLRLFFSRPHELAGWIVTGPVQLLSGTLLVLAGVALRAGRWKQTIGLAIVAYALICTLFIQLWFRPQA